MFDNMMGKNGYLLVLNCNSLISEIEQLSEVFSRPFEKLGIFPFCFIFITCRNTSCNRDINTLSYVSNCFLSIFHLNFLLYLAFQKCFPLCSPLLGLFFLIRPSHLRVKYIYIFKYLYHAFLKVST